MRLPCWIVALVQFAVLAAASSAAPSCRFAWNYTQADLLSSASARESYLLSAAYWEGHFHQPYVSYNPVNGYTYDGTPLNYTTGAAMGPIHGFSAPSKEAIHVSLLLKAVQGDALASLFVSPTDPQKATGIAISLLVTKITGYELFNASYPGFGGFMPWVNVSNTSSVFPLSSWSSSVPSLDNGELVWAIYAVAKTLPSKYADVAARYWAYFQYMALNAIPVFYAGNGLIRTVASISNVSAVPAQNKYGCEGICGYLNDPYEGELFAVMMDLYSPWAKYGFNASVEPDKIWMAKRALLQSVVYQSKRGNITVQRGWWFSSHEQWKYLELPYWDVSVNWRVFLNGERARSCHSAENNLPGLYASVNDVTNGGENIPDYDGATGIQSIAFESVPRTDVVTPYGSFPTILANSTVGLLWYDNMLKGPSMQGPHGSTEAVNINGTEISPLVTWDSKATTMLALTGGIANITRVGLIADKVYDRFVYVINREWSLAFPSLQGESLSFCIPSMPIPHVLSDFTSCSR